MTPSFKEKRDAAAEEYENNCHKARVGVKNAISARVGFEAGADWAYAEARREVLRSDPVVLKLVGALKSTVGFEPFDSLEPRMCSEALAAYDKAIAAGVPDE